MEPKISIIVDDREALAGDVQQLLARPDCEVVIRRLPLGDFRLAGRLLVERKRWPDLVASIADGRLFRQACRLAASPLHSVILLEGSEEDIAGGAMSCEAIQGALISVSIILGIPVLRSRSAEESARLMLYASRQLRSVIFGAVRRPGKRPQSKRRIQLHVLQGLPSVGPARAARMLDRYGSVEAVMTAGRDDLALVPGVGKSTAQKIRWAVTEPGVRTGYVARGQSRPDLRQPARESRKPQGRGPVNPAGRSDVT